MIRSWDKKGIWNSGVNKGVGWFGWSCGISVYAHDIIVQGDWEDKGNDFTFRSVEWRD